MKNLKNKLMAVVTAVTLSVSVAAFAEACKAPEGIPKPPQVTCPHCGHKFDMLHVNHARFKERMAKLMKKECALLAELTGGNADEIGTECREKKIMPAQFAKEAGVYDAYKAKKMDQVKVYLDKRVKDGKLTQEKADEKLEKFSSMLDDMSNGKRPFKGKHHRHAMKK